MTDSELADIFQQSHVSVMGCNSIPPSRISPQDPEVCRTDGRLMGGRWGSMSSQQGLKQRLKLLSCHCEWQSLEQRSEGEVLVDINQGGE